MTESLARLAVDLTANVAGFESDLGRANRMAQKFGRQLESDFGKIGAAIGGALASGFTVAAESVRRTVNEMDKIAEASARLAVSTEALSALGYAAKMSGSNAETLEKGLRKLSLTMAEAKAGGDAQVKLFQAVGVAVTDAEGKLRPVDQVFADLADRFKQYKSGAGEIKLATELFGKAGSELIPTLDNGREGLAEFADEAERLGLIIGTEAAQQAGEFNDNLDRLTGIVQGLANELTTQLLPLMIRFSELAIDNADKTGKAGTRFEALVQVFQAVAVGGAVVKNTWEAITNVIATAIDTVAIGIRGMQEGVTAVVNVGEAQLKGGPIAGLRTLISEYARFQGVQEGLIADLERSQQTAADGVGQAIADVKAAFAAAYDPIKKFEGAANDAGEAAGSLEAPLVGTGNAADKAGKDVAKLQKELQRTADEQERWKERLRDTEALLRGPMAQANLQLDRELDALGEALAEGSITAKQFAEEKARLIELHRREAAAIKAQKAPVDQMIADLEFELELMKMSNVERETAIALRQLEGKYTEEQAEKLRQLFSAREMADLAQQQSAEFLRVWDGAFAELGTKLVDAFKKGGGSIGDALGEALKESIGGALEELAESALKDFSTAVREALSGSGEGLSRKGANGLSVGTNAGLAAIGGIASSYVGSESTGQSVLGGAAAGAAYGTMILPGIGTIIGAILGAIVGFVSAQKPELEVSSSAGGIQAGKVEGRATSAFGNIFVGKEDFDFDAQGFADQIAAFDNALAGLLDTTELEMAREALQNFDVLQRRGNVNPAEILRQRFDAVVSAIEPEWVAWLGQFEELEDRVKQFEGLRELRKQVDTLDDVIRSLDPDALNQIRFALSNLAEAVADTSEQFRAAIEANDAVAVREAAAAFEQAVMRRYQAEVEMIRALQAQIDAASESARAFGISMAQRLRDVGADVSVADTIGAGLGGLRDSVGAASNVNQAIANLDRFLAALDDWLSASRAEIDQWATAARTRVTAALAALDAEQAGIMGEAQRRMQEAQSAAQAAAQAQQEALQAQLAILQEQLAVAQQWSGVLANAKRFLDQLTFSAANPLSGSSRLAAFDERIATLRSQLEGATGSTRANIAQELLQLLGERLTLAQGQFQRPSPEYLAIFNETAAETARLRDIAQAEADRAQAIQEEIAALQAQTVQGVSGVTDALYYLSTEELARLDAIEAERAALEAELLAIDEEQAARLAELNETARAQYEWAQTTGEQLQQQRHEELLASLHEITGGLDPDAYIAQRLAETTTLLTEIRDGILAFLEDVAENGPGSGVQPGTGPGAGRGGVGGDPRIPPELLPPAGTAGVTQVEQPIQLVLDGRVIGETSLTYIAAHASRIAPVLRREARVA